MSRSFYVDPVGGSDSNAGTSAAAAWRSLDKVGSEDFAPGDTILFARGGTWNGQLTVTSSGAEGAPVTYGAYGEGADPLFTDGRYGVDANGQDNIVVRDIRIANTGGAGIHGDGANNWTIDHVQIDRAGRAQDGSNQEWGGVQWWNSSGLTVANSTFTNLNGEAVWVWDGSNVKILNNDMRIGYGPYTDNAQLTYVNGYEIRGNLFSMAGPTNSGKGNLVVEESSGGVVANNSFEGGNFGLSVDSSNTLIEGNHFLGHTAQSWSAGVLLGSGLHGGSHDVTIKNNLFDGGRAGVSMFDLLGDAGDRQSVDIVGNLFRVEGETVSIGGDIWHSGMIADNRTLGAGEQPTFGGGTGPVASPEAIAAVDVFAPPVSAPAAPVPAPAPAMIAPAAEPYVYAQPMEFLGA